MRDPLIWLAVPSTTIRRAVIPTSARIGGRRMGLGITEYWGMFMASTIMYGTLACGLNFPEKYPPQRPLSHTSAPSQSHLSHTSALPLFSKS
jgi:hypothetical protein